MTAHAVKVQRITKSQPLGFYLFIMSLVVIASGHYCTHYNKIDLILK